MSLKTTDMLDFIRSQEEIEGVFFMRECRPHTLVLPRKDTNKPSEQIFMEDHHGMD